MPGNFVYRIHNLILTKPRSDKSIIALVALQTLACVFELLY